MKKLICMVLVLVMVIALCGCSAIETKKRIEIWSDGKLESVKEWTETTGNKITEKSTDVFHTIVDRFSKEEP